MSKRAEGWIQVGWDGGGGADNDRGNKLQNHPMTTPYTGEEASLLVRRNFGIKKKCLKKQGGRKKERKLYAPKKLGLREKF